MAISEQQFIQLQGVIDDPEKASNLSAKQLRQMHGLMVEFKAGRQSRTEALRAEGLSDEQIARVDEASRTAPPPAARGGLDPTAPAFSISPLGATGVVEGAKQAVEGVFDLAKDLSVGIHDLTGIGGSLEDEASRKKYKQGVAERRTKVRIQQIQEFGAMPEPAWDIMGNVMPWLLAAPAGAATFIGLVAKRMLQGGVMGASISQPEGEGLLDRWLTTSLGVGLGAISAVPEIFRGAKVHVAKSFVRNFNNRNSEVADSVQEAVRQMTGNKTFQFSLGQATGGRTAIGLEVRGATDVTKQAQNNNLDILAKHIFNTADSMSAAGASPGKIAVALRETLKSARDTIFGDASKAWTKSHKALIETFGDDVVIRGDEYLAKIDTLLGEATDTLTNPGNRGIKSLQKYRDAVDVEVNPLVPAKNAKGEWQIFDRKNGVWMPTRNADRAAVQAVADAQNADFSGIDTAATVRIMKGLNNLIGGRSVVSPKVSPGSNRETGRALMGSFTDSLESKSANGEAVKAINVMREDYKEAMIRAQAIDDTVVAQVFGGKSIPKNPGKKLDQVLKQEPEDLAATRDFLEEWNKPLLEELRATHMRRIAQTARSGRQPGVDTEVELERFLTRLEGSLGGTGEAGMGLHTVATQTDLRATANALRVIKNRYFTGVAPGGIAIDDIAINLVSRSPEFMARFITRVVSTGKSLEAGMLDQSFRSAMQRIAKQQVGSPLWKAAMVTLTEWTNKHQAIMDAEAQQAEQARRAKAREDNLTESTL